MKIKTKEEINLIKKNFVKASTKYNNKLKGQGMKRLTSCYLEPGIQERMLLIIRGFGGWNKFCKSIIKVHEITNKGGEEVMGYKIVDLFCGAGGLSEGFKQSGFSTLFSNDHDKSALETYSKNSNSELVSNDPIETIELSIIILITSAIDIFSFFAISFNAFSCCSVKYICVLFISSLYQRIFIIMIISFNITSPWRIICNNIVILFCT